MALHGCDAFPCQFNLHGTGLDGGAPDSHDAVRDHDEADQGRGVVTDPVSVLRAIHGTGLGRTGSASGMRMNPAGEVRSSSLQRNQSRAQSIPVGVHMHAACLGAVAGDVKHRP